MNISSSVNASYGFAQIGTQNPQTQASVGGTASDGTLGSGPVAGAPEDAPPPGAGNGPPPGGGGGGSGGGGGNGPPPGGGMAQTSGADTQSLILSLLEEASESGSDNGTTDSDDTGLASYGAKDGYAGILELAVQP